jgi:hypothetical protein
VTKQTVTLTIAPDQIPEFNEFLVMVLATPTNAVLGPYPTATVFITDDDPGTFKFSSPTFTVKEGEPVAVITVTRTGLLNQTVIASVSTANSTAVAPTDYTAVTDLQLTFGPNVLSQSFTVPIVDNEVKDVARTFIVRVTPVSPGTTVSLGGLTQVTIQDND